MNEERDNRVHVIEADHYREERARLAKDRIIQAMAKELPDDWRLTLTNSDDEPNYNFMLGANQEYDRRCKAAGVENLSQTIGAVAKSIIMVRKEQGRKGMDESNQRRDNEASK